MTRVMHACMHVACRFLEALVEKYKVANSNAAPLLKIGNPLGEEEAAALIQKNERGRQVRSCVCDRCARAWMCVSAVCRPGTCAMVA